MDQSDQDDLNANRYLATVREVSNLVPLVVTSAIPVRPADYFSRITKLAHHIEPTRETSSLSSKTLLFDGKPDPQWEAQTVLDFKRLQLALSAWTIRRERALKKRLDVIDVPTTDIRSNKNELNDVLPAPLFSPPRIAGIEEWRSYCYAESNSQAVSSIEERNFKVKALSNTAIQTWSAPGDEEEDDYDEDDEALDLKKGFEEEEGEEDDDDDDDKDGGGDTHAFDDSDDSDLDCPSPSKRLKVSEEPLSTCQKIKYIHPNPPFLSSLLMYDHLMIARLLSRSIKHATAVFKMEKETVSIDHDVSNDEDGQDTFDHESEAPSVYIGKIPLRSHSVAMRCTLFAASTRGAISQGVDSLRKDRLPGKTSAGYFSGILSPSECLWIYALLAKLEQPLQGSVVASVRTLHVLACEMRRVTAQGLDQGERMKDPNTEALRNQLAALNTLLCVTGKVYSQAWVDE